MSQCATPVTPVRKSCCPHVSKVEAEWRHYLHEANRARFFGNKEAEQFARNRALKAEALLNSIMEDIQ